MGKKMKKIDWTELAVYSVYRASFIMGILVFLVGFWTQVGLAQFFIQAFGLTVATYIFILFLNPYCMVFSPIGPDIIRKDRIG